MHGDTRIMMKPLGPDEFSRRYSVRDLEGVLGKRATVQQGELGLEFRDGKFQSYVESRSPMLSNLLDRLSGHNVELVKVRTGEFIVELPPFHTFAGGPRAVVECKVVLQYLRGQEGVFVTNVMYGKECLVCGDIAKMLGAPARRAASDWLLDHKEDVKGRLDLSDLEVAMLKSVDDALKPKGVSAVRVEAMLSLPDRDEQLLADEEFRQNEARLALLERRGLMWDRIEAADAKMNLARLGPPQRIKDFLRSLDKDSLLSPVEVDSFVEQLRSTRRTEEAETAHGARIAGLRRDAEYTQLEHELAEGSGLIESVANSDGGCTVMTRRLCLLEVNNCDHMRITCKKYVAKIVVTNSDDILVIAEDGYGNKECINSDRVKVTG